MTIRDFFRLVIKLFGLYSLIITVFYFIPANIGYAVYEFELISILWILGTIALVALIFIFLIQKTEWLINFLKIDKNFDGDRINFGNLDTLKIFKLAAILFGGFLIIDYLPVFLQYSFMAFKEKVSSKGLNSLDAFVFGDTLDYFQWVISGMNLILGYILLTNYDRIAKWLTRKERNNS